MYLSKSLCNAFVTAATILGSKVEESILGLNDKLIRWLRDQSCSCTGHIFWEIKKKCFWLRCLALHNQLFLEAMLYSFYRHVYLLAVNSTVGINPIISDLNIHELQNWAEGTLKPIKFANIHKKTQEQKWLKNWTILKNLKETTQISVLRSFARPASGRQA
jgi:hypothetical protein